MTIMTDDRSASPGVPDDPGRGVTPAGREAFELSFAWWQEHRRYMADLQSATGLSPMEVHAVRALEPGRPVPTVALAQQIHCEPSNITGIVDRLVRAGLVERAADQEDRRVRLVSLTDAGVTMHRRLNRRLATPPAAIGRLSAADQRTLRDLLRRMVGPA